MTREFAEPAASHRDGYLDLSEAAASFGYDNPAADRLAASALSKLRRRNPSNFYHIILP